MWKIATLACLIGTPAIAQAGCDVGDLFYQTTARVSDSLAYPETAQFPEIEDVDITQEGSKCSFMFKFNVTSENYHGERVDSLIWALVFRNFVNGKLLEPEFEIFD